MNHFQDDSFLCTSWFMFRALWHFLQHFSIFVINIWTCMNFSVWLCYDGTNWSIFFFTKNHSDHSNNHSEKQTEYRNRHNSEDDFSWWLLKYLQITIVPCHFWKHCNFYLVRKTTVMEMQLLTSPFYHPFLFCFSRLGNGEKSLPLPETGSLLLTSRWRWLHSARR